MRKFVNLKLSSKIRYSLMTHGILKIFSNYSIFQGQQKYYRPKLDNTKDILRLLPLYIITRQAPVLLSKR